MWIYISSLESNLQHIFCSSTGLFVHHQNPQVMHVSISKTSPSGPATLPSAMLLYLLFRFDRIILPAFRVVGLSSRLSVTDMCSFQRCNIFFRLCNSSIFVVDAASCSTPLMPIMAQFIVHSLRVFSSSCSSSAHCLSLKLFFVWPWRPIHTIDGTSIGPCCSAWPSFYQSVASPSSVVKSCFFVEGARGSVCGWVSHASLSTSFSPVIIRRTSFW